MRRGLYIYLGVEEVHDWNEGRVEDDPDDVKFPLQITDADGCDLDDWEMLGFCLAELNQRHTHKVEDPICRSAQRSSLCSHTERIDLGAAAH